MIGQHFFQALYHTKLEFPQQWRIHTHTHTQKRKYGYLTGKRHHWEWSALTNGFMKARTHHCPGRNTAYELQTSRTYNQHSWSISLLDSIYKVNQFYSNIQYNVIHRCTSGVPPWSLENSVDLVHFVSRRSGATCSPKPYKIFEGSSEDNWMNWFSNTIPPTELLKLNTEFLHQHSGNKNKLCKWKIEQIIGTSSSQAFLGRVLVS